MKHKKTFVISIFIAMFTVFTLKNYFKNSEKGEKIAKNILQVLQKNCDCKKIKLATYSLGKQYSFNNGFTTEQATFTLTGCNYKNINQEVKRIEKILKREVEGIKDFNLIDLDFISEAAHQTVTLTNY